MIDPNYIMSNIEHLACDAANAINALQGRKTTSVEELYTTIGNVAQRRALAQNFALYVLKTYFGFSYPVLVQRSGYDEKAVMKCVKRVQEGLRMNDILYIQMEQEVRTRLVEEYGE